ncbi:glycosyltransferase family 4 protein [Ornithinimicrobium sp. Y1847]|uniref:glycosyltransferase family 4 protein n=1 Tax=Ornithinimicrobium sp. Y1847 TaxID=3405419 RepID=UPI003B682C55
MTLTLNLIANNGEVGGGEVMLLSMAHAARDAGHRVVVVAPASPGECADGARHAGFAVVALPGEGRRGYMRALRGWARTATGLLWCNGLVPATATALLHRPRVVHLHRLPEGRQWWAARLSQLHAMRVVVPSLFMAARLPGSEVLPNWTRPMENAPRRSDAKGPAVLGFLGRLAPEKGLPVLLDALDLVSESGVEVRLLVAGEARFTDDVGSRELEGRLTTAGARVEMLGWVEPEDLFAQIDGLVVPSVGPESFGLSAAEAMAAQVPLVVTDVGALPEVVGPTHPYIARAGSADDLARTLRGLLADVTAADAATATAYDRWRTTYSPSAGQARFAGLLSTLMTGVAP